MKVFFKTNKFIWFLYFETQQVKVIHDLYSQCLIQILSKTTFFSNIWREYVSVAFDHNPTCLLDSSRSLIWTWIVCVCPLTSPNNYVRRSTLLMKFKNVTFMRTINSSYMSQPSYIIFVVSCLTLSIREKNRGCR